MGDTITITDCDGVTRTFEAGGPGQPITVPRGAIKAGSEVAMVAWLPTAFTQSGPAGFQLSIPPGYPWRDEAEECRRISMTDPGAQPVRAWAPVEEVDV